MIDAPVISGNDTQAVDPRQAVHNEQHGGVVTGSGPDVRRPSGNEDQTFRTTRAERDAVTPMRNTSKGTTIRSTRSWTSSVDPLLGPHLSRTGTSSARLERGSRNRPQFNEKAFTAASVMSSRGKGAGAFADSHPDSRLAIRATRRVTLFRRGGETGETRRLRTEVSPRGGHAGSSPAPGTTRAESFCSPTARTTTFDGHRRVAARVRRAALAMFGSRRRRRDRSA